MSEHSLLKSVENGEWHSVPDLAPEIQRYQRYAQAQLNALQTVSIELPASDLQSLQTLAQQSDTSVSLLIASVLHQFVNTHQK